MSCFMVSDDHITYMLCALYEFTPSAHGKPDKDELTRLGGILQRECALSVTTRYREETRREDLAYTLLIGPFKLSPVRQQLDAVTALKQVACYEYQACESPNWQHSEARKVCRKIERAIIQALPGYEKAPWGIGVS
jgi:hypothetical protein